MKGAEENMISHGSVNFDLTEFYPRVVFFCSDLSQQTLCTHQCQLVLSKQHVLCCGSFKIGQAAATFVVCVSVSGEAVPVVLLQV